MHKRKVILSKLKKTCSELTLAASNDDQEKLEKGVANLLVSIKLLAEEGMLDGDAVMFHAETVLEKLSKSNK